MKKLINLVFLSMFVINMIGCATILKEKTTDVKIDSDPEGAVIYHNYKYGEFTRIGVTPATIKFDNRHNIKLVFKKPGYEDTRAQIRAGVAPGWQLASLACGVLPAIPDFFFKNARNLNRKEISVSLPPALSSPAPQTGFTGSHADEIIKYKKLLDSGVITKEEFEQKKKYHLGS